MGAFWIGRLGFTKTVEVPEGDRIGFVMLGKTFKGMTDAMLDWQTTRFTELAVGGTDGQPASRISVFIPRLPRAIAADKPAMPPPTIRMS